MLHLRVVLDKLIPAFHDLVGGGRFVLLCDLPVANILLLNEYGISRQDSVVFNNIAKSNNLVVCAHCVLRFVN